MSTHLAHLAHMAADRPPTHNNSNSTGAATTEARRRAVLAAGRAPLLGALHAPEAGRGGECAVLDGMGVRYSTCSVVRGL